MSVVGSVVPGAVVPPFHTPRCLGPPQPPFGPPFLFLVFLPPLGCSLFLLGLCDLARLSLSLAPAVGSGAVGNV